MTKADLKNGMVIEYRDGIKALLINDVLMSRSGYMSLRQYNDDLTAVGSELCDIVKIYNTLGKTFHTVFESPYLKLIWKRKEAKEMTLAEIEKELGYPVKIVG